MKTYKTWEMIKMLSEDKDLEFKREPNIGPNIRVGIDRCGYVSTLNQNLNYIVYLDTDYEWKLVQQPVDFFEAMRAHVSGKTISCDFRGFNLKYKPNDRGNNFKFLEDINGHCVSSDEILLGKWFIESED